MSHPHVTSLGRILVGPRASRKGIPEHERDPLPHHPHLIHGVHQRLGGGREKIALSVVDHQKYHPGLATTLRSRDSVSAIWRTRPSSSGPWQIMPDTAVTGRC